jgi:hypothetical protein
VLVGATERCSLRSARPGTARASPWHPTSTARAVPATGLRMFGGRSALRATIRTDSTATVTASGVRTDISSHRSDLRGGCGSGRRDKPVPVALSRMATPLIGGPACTVGLCNIGGTEGGRLRAPPR